MWATLSIMVRIYISELCSSFQKRFVVQLTITIIFIIAHSNADLAHSWWLLMVQLHDSVQENKIIHLCMPLWDFILKLTLQRCLRWQIATHTFFLLPYGWRLSVQWFNVTVLQLCPKRHLAFRYKIMYSDTGWFLALQQGICAVAALEIA